MKLKPLVVTTLVALAASGTPAIAADDYKPSPTEAAQIAKARASYPLKTCLVSDESLGSMGEAVGYVHREAGKPDRVVFVCCEGCIDDFKKEPAKFLKKVDDAAAKAKSGQGKKADKSKN